MNREALIENLLGLLKNSPSPIKLNEIAKALQIRSDNAEYEIMKDILSDLTEKNIINKSSRRRYSMANVAEGSSYEGVIHIRNDKGILLTDIPELQKITINPKHLNTALEGDTVRIQLHAQKPNKKPRGEVIDIISRSSKDIYGTLDNNGYFYFIIPDEEYHYVDFLVPEEKLGGAKQGDKVRAKLLNWDNPQHNPTAEIVEIFGRAGQPGVEYEAIIKEFELPDEFPGDVLEEAKTYQEPGLDLPEGRLDLRDKLIITIDPFDAKDFDDALSLEILDNGNYYLGVHIADVSHYVRENTALDIEARFRGNSVYLVDRVVPMLPEELSNNICSLKPGVPRNAFTVFMEISPRGAVKNYQITESLIISKRRYTYEEVLDIIQKGEGENAGLLLELDKLAKLLRRKRYLKGGINFDTQEVKFKLDENKYPVQVEIKRSSDSTKLVEECMLITNQIVAGHVKKLRTKFKQRKTPTFLYRVHEDPDQKKISEAVDFITRFGVKVDKKSISSKEINKILKEFEERPEKFIVNQILIRSMAKAVYSHNNIGHFGLGFDDYSHFTSPIRRYPDLIVHRLLKEYAKGRPDDNRIEFIKMFVRDAGNHCTATERTAMEAERASTKLTHAVMAQDMLGNDYDGRITGVTSFGLFVQLDDFYGEGLLHIRDMKDDYYYFDEKNLRLIGKRLKRVYGFGDRLRVKIVRVNVDKRQIDLAYVGDSFDKEGEEAGEG